MDLLLTTNGKTAEPPNYHPTCCILLMHFATTRFFYYSKQKIAKNALTDGAHIYTTYNRTLLKKETLSYIVTYVHSLHHTLPTTDKHTHTDPYTHSK